MTALALFDALAPVLPVAVEAQLGRRDACIFATRVALEVAVFFGVDARPLPVQVLLANEAFSKHLDEGDQDVRKWADIDGSHSVGIGFGYLPGQVPFNSWNGHLILAADGVFGDFSIQQAERPEKGIVTGPAVVGPLPDRLNWTLVGPNGTSLHYRRIEDRDYRHSPDWRLAHRRRRICALLIRALQEVRNGKTKETHLCSPR